MNDYDNEADKTRQLTADLQKAALSLIEHLRTNNFRIQIEGIVPAVYITLGEGRSSYSADSVILHGAQSVTPELAPVPTHEPALVAVQEGAQRTALAACISRLRKALAA